MRRIALLTALAVLISVGTPGSANADDVEVVAQVLAGSRTITLAELATPLADVLRAVSVDGELAVTVTELAVNGANPWSLKVQLCGPDDLDPNVSDCGDHPAELVHEGAGDPIPGTAMEISDRTVIPALGGGTSTAVSGVQDLSTERTIFNNTGQDPLALYTGEYVTTSTVSLTPPVDSVAGEYTGFLVVTLYD